MTCRPFARRVSFKSTWRLRPAWARAVPVKATSSVALKNVLCSLIRSKLLVLESKRYCLDSKTRSFDLMRLHKTFFSATLLVALAGTALAQAGRSIHVDLKETRLANGLHVITVEDHSAPVIAVNVTYNVGSRNEKPGRTGFAHLFEHMMFQGSENVGKSEHFILVYNNGGTMNGSTNEDRATR